MENFTPLSSAVGGILIGLAATMLLLNQGRIAGISNIVGGLFETNENERVWRLLFLAGLIIGSLAYVFFGQHAPEVNMNPFKLTDNNQILFMILGGLLVGLGSQIGSGCTSGHGVCGLGRFSMRSLIAVITFMLTAGTTVFFIRILTGA